MSEKEQPAADVLRMIEQARAQGLKVPDYDWYYGRTQLVRDDLKVVPLRSHRDAQRRHTNRVGRSVIAAWSEFFRR